MTSLLLLAWTLLRPIDANGVSVTIADLRDADRDDATARHHARFRTKDISFEGSHVRGAALHAADEEGDVRRSVAAPLAYALPNEGGADGLMNEAALNERIVLFDRGRDVSIHKQVYTAQHAGAVAAIIVDFPNNREKQTALLAAVESKSDLDLWESLTIPSVIVTFDHGERLKSSMKLVKGDILHHKNQNIMAESEFVEWILHHDDDPELIYGHDEL